MAQSLRLCSDRAPGTPGVSPTHSGEPSLRPGPDPDRGHRGGKGGRFFSQIQAVPGGYLPSAPQAHPHLLPSAAATHWHHGRHWITQVFAHFIVEIIPARVEEAGQGKGGGSVRKEEVVVNSNYFLEHGLPTPQGNEVPGLRTSALTWNRPCFPSGWFRAGSRTSTGRRGAL